MATTPNSAGPGGRFGITIPFDGVPLSEQRDWFRECADLGYTDLWSSEANGADAFTPLALAAAWVPEVRLGTAIVPAYTRGPALLAQSVATMAEAAPGRFVFGIGTSSDVIVERWNGIPFEEPYKKVRDTVRFLKEALSGQKVEGTYDTVRSAGFRLGRRLPQVPPILIAALRPGMLRLAGREADGAIINWLSADDVRQVAPEVGAGKEIVARIFVCPSEDVDTVRAAGRFAVAAYLNVPVYAAFHEWLGRGDRLEGMWSAWKAGDRKAATAAIPDEVVDDLIIHGSPAKCREQLARYVENGVTTPVLAVMPFGIDVREAVRSLAPANA
ncbi:MAG TPA: LLM class F420-dependent oxidoreductase [Acidimicrobiales bacterium]|nr:LLM class F420-dependent oxidoreductase [Acidimicrobiales bacterium]